VHPLATAGLRSGASCAGFARAASALVRAQRDRLSPRVREPARRTKWRGGEPRNWARHLRHHLVCRLPQPLNNREIILQFHGDQP
jgi:hypothetical protein